MTGAGASALIVLFVALVPPLAAQDAPAANSGEWRFSNLLNGFCLVFLADSADARHFLPDGAVPARADATPTLHPALARAIADQPEYGSWTPAHVCVYRFGAAEVNGKELVAREGDGETVGWVGFTARALANQPPGSAVAVLVFTSDWRAQRAAETARLRLRTEKLQFGQAPKSTDDRYVLELGKTRIIWDGRAGADSAGPSGLLVDVFVREARSGPPVMVRWELSALERRSMIGALIVEGKDRLARALRKSPIRFVGPFYRGGQGRLSLH